MPTGARRLEDKTAMVTGAAAGIGAAVARRMASEGADIVAVDVDVVHLEELAQEIRRSGRKCLTAVADVTSSQQMRSAVEQATGQFGGIHILVNNAGGYPAASRADFALDQENWDEAYRLNLKSQFIATSLVLPGMKERCYGKIVNVSSISAKLNDVHRVAYGAAKAGVISFTRALARELGKYNINVNSVCPGLVWTPQWEREAAHMASIVPSFRGFTPRQVFDYFARTFPLLGKGQEPEDIASVIVFLSTEDSRMITGQSLNVDGGIVFD